MNKNNEDKNCECIILNKAFEGVWNDKEGNISHEIINFFKADDDKYYVYNSPYGSIREGVFVDKNLDDYIYKPRKTGNAENKEDKKIAKATYLVIASTSKITNKNEQECNEDSKQKSSSFYLKYVIKLKKRIARPTSSNNKFTAKYGGEDIYEILQPSSKCSLISFEAEWITKVDKFVQINAEDYVYQRNRGYVYSDEHPKTYSALMTAINHVENKIDNLDIKKIDVNNFNNSARTITFLDLLLKVDNEESYTNLLFQILKYKDVFRRFIQYLKNKIHLNTDIDINNMELVLKREKGINYGRMDISVESKPKGVRVFIENKILSGLNGIKSDNNSTTYSQITTYYNWASEDKNTPLGFIFVPDYQVTEIENELKNYNEQGKCNIIKYSLISDFLKEIIYDKVSGKVNKKFWENFEFCKYIEDFCVVFDRHSYNLKMEKFTNDFIQAIKQSKEEKQKAVK